MDTTLFIALALLSLLILAVYPWLAVGLFLAVPMIKVAGIYYVPFFRTVDMTGLACGLALVFGLWNYFRYGRAGPPLVIPWRLVICMATIAAILFLGLTWTTAPSYGLRKALRFGFMSMPLLLLPVFYVRSKKDGRAMIRMVILIGSLMALALSLVPTTQLAELVRGRGYGRATFLASGANMPAALIAVGSLSLVTTFLVKASASRLLRYAALVILPLALYAILLSGSRANMLGLLATAAILPFFAGKGERGKALVIAFVLIPLVFAVAFTFMTPGGRLARLSARWEDLVARRGLTVEARVPHYTFVLTHWWSRPFLGHGPGSFAVDFKNADEPHWPHNIVLEALYETGVVGMTALLFFIYFVVKLGLRGLRGATTPEDRLLVAAPIVMVTFMMAPAMTHWDLEGMRLLYLFSGLLHVNVTQVTLASRERITVPYMIKPGYYAIPSYSQP